MLVMAALYKGRFRELEKRKQQERESVIRQLPEFVNRLVLLLNAGLVLTTAFERSVEESMALSDPKKDYFYGEIHEIYVHVKTPTDRCTGSCGNLPSKRDQGADSRVQYHKR